MFITGVLLQEPLRGLNLMQYVCNNMEINSRQSLSMYQMQLLLGLSVCVGGTFIIFEALRQLDIIMFLLCLLATDES